MDPGLTGLTVAELKAFNWNVLRLYYERIINDAYAAMGFVAASSTSPSSTTLEDRVRSLEETIFPVATGGNTPTNLVWVDVGGTAYTLTGAQYAALRAGLSEVVNASYNNWRSHYNAIDALTLESSLISYDVTVNWPTANVGTLDPSVSGFAASVGSSYFNTSTKATYTKTGALNTDWTQQRPGLATTNVGGIGSGIVVQDNNNNVFVRSLTQPGAGITISNANGISGNPTFALSDDLAAIEGLTGTGIAVRTTANTWTNRTLSAGSTKISLSNADGVSGNPSIDAVEANFALNNIGGTLGISKGGTGLTATPTNGQVLIGNGAGYALSTLSTSTGISVTNGAGTITINNTGVLSFAGGTTGLTPAAATTGAITLAGTLSVANGGTGVTTTPTNGQLLIGNGTGYTVANITAGTGINITNGAGTITITNTGSGTGGGLPGACRVATTGNINLSAPGATIDGITMASGDRVLVWQQTTPSQNGIYVWNGAASAMTRASDMSTDWNTQVPGRRIRILEGTTYGDNFVFACDSGFGGTFGVTSILINSAFSAIGPILVGNGATAALAGTGGFGQRIWTAIDTNGYCRIWRWDNVANGNSSGFEFAVGNNSNLANNANYWWDISVHSGGEEGFRVARRTGGTIVSKVFIDTLGRVTIGNTTEPGGGSGGPNYASINGVTLYVNSTDAARIPVGTTAQRPTPIKGMIRQNATDEVFEISMAPTVPAGFTTWAGLQQSIMYRKRPWWIDDFASGSSASTGVSLYGELNWSVTATGTAANSIIAGVSNHPGILQLGTGATTGNSTRIHLGATATTPVVLANEVEYFAFLVRIPTITASDCFVGLVNDASSTTVNSWGTNAVWFQFDNATSANIQFYCRSGGTSSGAVNGPVFAANTWYLCEAYYTGTSWIPVINGVEYTAVTTNIPTAAVSPAVTIVTNTTASRTVQIDSFAMYTIELGARY